MAPVLGSVTNGLDRANVVRDSRTIQESGVAENRQQYVNGHSDGILANGDKSAPTDTPTASYEPIAIIGCAMRLPGGVSDGQALWDLLDGKQDGRCRVPEDRYNIDAFYGPGKAGHVCTEYGHFLQHVNLGEAETSFWSMTRSEIEQMDPQQILALEVVYECLQNSGTTKWKGKNIGTYVGIFGQDWSEMQVKETQDSSAYRLTGNGDFVVANRLSYEFGLQGPSMTIRTACSSSLTAIHEACMGIHHGDCDSAIIAGTNLILNPHMTIAMTEQGILAEDGRCKTFDESADGYARGEGVVAIQIKRLADAIRDNDPIRAVIRSSCTNGDGKTSGISQPSSASHEVLIRRSHQLAGISDFSKTAMIECHGTGTQVGDPLEAMAVARVFGKKETLIGSIKPNLGHSEGASGVTSVIKSVLALERRLIPPNVNFSKPNPKIPFEKSKLKVPVGTMQWPKGKAERIGVNSFGIGGANAHVLLDSAAEMGVGRPYQETSGTDPYYLLTFSANTPDGLRKTIQNHEKYLQRTPERLADLSYTLNVRREPLTHRTFAVVAPDDAGGQWTTSTFEKVGDAPTVAFVFTGQGAQWARMGAELFEYSLVYRKAIAKMEATLAHCADPPSWSLKDELLKPKDSTRLSVAEFSQPCCTAVQVALVDVLREWGVTPWSVVGHSSGEIAAAYASDALSAEDAIEIAYYRGKLTAEITSKGGMAAVGLGRSEVERFLKPGVVIGCENSPSSVTLSGDLDVLAIVMEEIKRKFPEVLLRALRVDCAYHSDHMKAVGSRYASKLTHIRAKDPQTAFFSSVTGSKLQPKQSLDASYWVANLLSPVLFSSAVSELLQDAESSRILLEVGPHAALAGPLRQILKANKASKTEYASILMRDQDCRCSILNCAGTLFKYGVNLEFPSIVPTGHTLVDLPTYPWQRDKYTLNESRLSKGWRQRRFPKHDLLGARVTEASEYDPTWRNLLRLDDVPWLRDHALFEDIVFPGAGYIAMAGEAVRQLSSRSDFTVREVTIGNTLVLHEGAVTEIITHLKAARLTVSLDSTWYEFEISSLSGDRWVKHASGQVRPGSDYEAVRSDISALKRPVDPKHWYSVMRRFGFNYGPRFQGLTEISADVLERKAVAIIENSTGAKESVYALHPSTIDLTLQMYSVAAYKGQSRRFVQLTVPNYIEELYIKPPTGSILVQADTEVTPRGTIFGDMVGNSGSETVIRIKNIKMTPLTDAADARGHDPHAAVEMVWKPDISFVDNGSLMRIEKDLRQLCFTLERMALACMVECSLQLERKQPQEPFLAKYRAWLDKVRTQALRGEYPNVPDGHAIVAMSSSQRQLLIREIYESLLLTEIKHLAIAVQRIFQNSEAIFSGQADSLEVLMQDDILTEIYNFIGASDVGDFFVLAAHYKPNLRILEIGAGTGGTTNSVLQQLASRAPYADRNYYSYTFTDISPGFFARAKERFKAYDAIEYKVLDISRDPTEQGFEPQSFDLIVASNVIHATPRIVETLNNVRTMLAPTGVFFLQELSPPTKWLNFIMGTLSGWWLGEPEGRVEEPYVSPDQWDKYLRQAGFSGVDAQHHDLQFNATMTTRPAAQQPSRKITLISNNRLVPQSRDVVSTLNARGYEVDLRSWGQTCPPGQDIVAVMDIDGPFLHDMQEDQYLRMQDFVQSAKTSSSGILWVTGLCQIKTCDPRYGMSIGWARTLRSELSIEIATLELEHFDQAGWDALADLLPAFQRRRGDEQTDPTMEWAFVDGVLQVGRYHWTSVNNELAVPQNDATVKVLDIGKRGFLNTLYWKPCALKDPPQKWVQVRNCAVGLNFKDVLIAMGIVEGSVIEGDGFGFESAGVVEKVAPGVKSLMPGDRCVTLASGALSTEFITTEEVCVKIPDSLSFAEAATIPTVYCTVLFSLVDKARLEKGQSILIHSACGGVGIAAIQLSKHLGAEIYCTVGTEEKVQHLINTYDIPRERIFNSRDLSFQRDLLEATNGRGVDVVLNSLSGELLHASWKCVAEFGCMVEIGKRDLIGKGALALGPFQENRSYIGVDFALICGERPWIAGRLLREYMDLLRNGALRPITPITLFEADKIEGAMRFMQKGNHTGKIVITMPEGADELTTQAAKQTFRLQSNASYLLVGGLGGLGRAIAVWMAEAGATEIIFLSRSADKSDRYAAFVDELKTLGCDAVMISGSVVDKSAVEKAIGSATKPLRGVMQASMVLKDASFPSMRFDDWQQAVQPKVKGTWNIHHALLERKIDVDFLILFSSMSAVIGQSGQANYASANSFLDSFVQYRRSQGLAAAAIGIGVMDDVGYVSRNAHILDYFRQSSSHILYEQDLLDSIHLMINRCGPQHHETAQAIPSGDEIGKKEYVSKGQMVIGLRSLQPLSAPNNRAVWKRDPRMSLYHNIESHNKAASTSKNEQLKEFLAESSRDPVLLDSDESARFLATEIVRTLFGFLMRDEEELDVDVSPSMLGVDSLVSIELRNWFRQSLGFEISVPEILGAQSIRALGVHSAAMLKGKFMGVKADEGLGKYLVAKAP